MTEPTQHYGYFNKRDNKMMDVVRIIKPGNVSEDIPAIIEYVGFPGSTDELWEDEIGNWVRPISKIAVAKFLVRHVHEVQQEMEGFTEKLDGLHSALNEILEGGLQES